MWEIHDTPAIRWPGETGAPENRFPLEPTIAAAHERQYGSGPFPLYGRMSVIIRARLRQPEAVAATIEAFTKRRKTKGRTK